MLVIQSRNMTEDPQTDEKPLIVACLVFQYTHNTTKIAESPKHLKLPSGINSGKFLMTNDKDLKILCIKYQHVITSNEI
jgi:hypothetical protein